MSFDHPLALWLLLLLPLDVFLAFRRGRHISAALLLLSTPADREAMRRRRKLLAILSLSASSLFIFSISLALAAPSWGATTELVERDGLEIAVVLDVSRSMLAEDMAPPTPGLPGSRLAAALSFARLAPQKAPGAAFSLIADKGGGLVLVPMTDDLDAYESGLDWAGPGAMSKSGTDLGAGIDAALSSFSPLAGQGNLILLLSDGGDLAGSARAAALRAREKGARIIAVGFGGQNPVPVPDENGKAIGDGKGGILKVALEADLLRDLARATGGRYIDASDGSALTQITEEFGREARGGYRVEERPRDRTAYFAVLALAALLLKFSASLLAQRVRPLRPVRGGGA